MEMTASVNDVDIGPSACQRKGDEAHMVPDTSRAGRGAFAMSEKAPGSTSAMEEAMMHHVLIR
jgi:hypothetical protein